jgi:hypothetical protein
MGAAAAELGEVRRRSAPASAVPGEAQQQQQQQEEDEEDKKQANGEPTFFLMGCCHSEVC